MNRNFKVVFSKARGALMVVNEATSSVQAKGTKTVMSLRSLSSQAWLRLRRHSRTSLSMPAIR